MSEEVKAKVADLKDFGQQVKLEVGMKARDAKEAALEKAVDLSGHELTTQEKVQGVKVAATDKLKNAGDYAQQVGLEIRKKARDAKVDVDKSDTGKALGQAKDSTRDALVDTKHSILDAITPATKTVEATSTRGVDITHVENNKNDLVEAERQERLLREKRETDRLAEEKRQALLDSAKEKVAAVSEKTEGVRAVLSSVKDQAEVALGTAALKLKDKIEDSLDDGPREKVTPRISERGIDISAVQNPRNDDLSAAEKHKAALAEAAAPKSPTLGDKIKSAVAGVKEKLHEATTDAPAPIIVHKTSERGVDISHVENAANRELAAKEQERLDAEKTAALQREKAVLSDELVHPLKEKVVGPEDSLKSKLSALGSSISAAASKAASAAKEKYNELAHPAPVDVHEKRSENGIDTTSIQNADNNVIGERIRAEKNSLLPASLGASTAATEPKDSSATESIATKEPLEDRAIKGVLDAGVAARDAGHKVEYHAKIAKAQADIAAGQAKEAVQQKVADVKAAVQPTTVI